ncbi:MAG TPA: DUF3096 domain-containing protein [Rhizomicrobium sp.]|nr:DUF3096 domain-containing protein [Rhizomicrobium sp.]
MQGAAPGAAGAIAAALVNVAAVKPARQPRFFKDFQGLRRFHAPGNPAGALYLQDTEDCQTMHVDVITIQPLVALLFGILILILPRLLNYLIAIYLIFIGLVGLFPHIFTTAI